MTVFIPSLPFDADLWRFWFAGASLLTLFLLTVALRIYGHELTFAWRNVLRVADTLLAVLAYTAFVRAKSTPSSFPEQSPDLGLVLLALIGTALLIAVLGVFESHRRPPSA